MKEIALFSSKITGLVADTLNKALTLLPEQNIIGDPKFVLGVSSSNEITVNGTHTDTNGCLQTEDLDLTLNPYVYIYVKRSYNNWETTVYTITLSTANIDGSVYFS